MIYCGKCATKYSLATDCYFAIANGQCEICSKHAMANGGTYSKWIGIYAIVIIAIRRNMCQSLDTRAECKDCKRKNNVIKALREKLSAIRTLVRNI